MSNRGDDGQMDAFARFLEADHALRASLAIGAWLDVEQRYNGGGYGGVYAARLEAAAALYSSHGAPTAPRVLRRGNRGPDVVALQAALGVRADGDFGPATEEAVRLFQTDRGLLVDGIVGAMTLMALR
jgi:peptidoglycan hydrolase-like protein with peptidoglycan-binding domain